MITCPACQGRNVLHHVKDNKYYCRACKMVVITDEELSQIIKATFEDVHKDEY